MADPPILAANAVFLLQTLELEILRAKVAALTAKNSELLSKNAELKAKVETATIGGQVALVRDSLAFLLHQRLGRPFGLRKAGTVTVPCPLVVFVFITRDCGFEVKETSPRGDAARTVTLSGDEHACESAFDCIFAKQHDNGAFRRHKHGRGDGYTYVTFNQKRITFRCAAKYSKEKGQRTRKNYTLSLRFPVYTE